MTDLYIERVKRRPCLSNRNRIVPASSTRKWEKTGTLRIALKCRVETHTIFAPAPIGVRHACALLPCCQVYKNGTDWS